MKLLVVVLNYRTTDLAIDCLRSLSGEVGSVPGMMVVVCDNATGGDAEERLRHAIETNGWGTWARLKVTTHNLGFTGGNNIVIREAMESADPPEYVLLLNSDTIVQPGAMSALVEFMDRNPGVGIAGSRLESPDGEVQGSPFRFHRVASEFERGVRVGIISRLLRRWIVVMPKQSEPCEAEWVAGASMIIRQGVIEQIGMLDEDYFTYFEDIDFCMNARRAGWSVWYVPQSRIVHLEGAASGISSRAPKRRPGYWFQARRRFFLKNYGRAYAALADAAFIVGYAMWRVRRALSGRPDTDPPHLLGDFIRNSVFLTGFRVRPVEHP